MILYDTNKIMHITDWLIVNVFRNDHIMFTDNRYVKYKDIDLVDIIASLHNLLYECVTGERYDYMFHWTNKIGGAYPKDNIFDNMEEINE